MGERSTVLRYWRAAIAWELNALWWLRRSPVGRKIGLTLRHVVSTSPLRDVSVITWTFYVMGVYLSGFHFAISCALNLGGVLILRVLIGAKRPCEYDNELRQYADKAYGNFPLPAVETHMAVVVFGQLAAESGQFAYAAWPAAVITSVPSS